ncbi:MAG: hypothetical protein M9928_22035 [Anaerolineae bacterium]|nr:hypothetical protein [Anaerolineae bacterium]MCO5187009.1 hypothetical protein [Anaerolineae bacterium]MCO5207696.1 hypothetical protein [Anaerolineae bacterium]
MIEKRDQSQPLPGIVETLKIGFEITTRNMWLLLFPMVLDVFLWIGPRLSPGQLVGEWLVWWQQQATALQSAETANLVQPEVFDSLAGIANQYNVMSQMSLPFLGIPSLMGSLAPETTPLAATTFEISSASALLNQLLVLSLLGLIGSGIFYGFLGFVVRGEGDWSAFGRKLPHTVVRLIGLAFLLLGLIVLLYIPIALVGATLAILSPALLTVAILVAFVVIFWLLLYMGFTLQGIFLDYRPIFNSIRHSIRFVRSNAAAALPLLILVYLINNVLNLVWLSADSGNWLTLISIFGHAFISTALIVSTFVFYHDRQLMMGMPVKT